MLIPFIKLSSENKIVHVLLKKIKSSNDLIYKGFNFLGAFKRALYIDLDENSETHDIYKSLKQGDLKKNYKTNSYYFYLLANLFLIKNRKFLLKYNYFTRYFTELNFLTKFFAKVYICFRFDYQTKLKRKQGKDLIYYHSNSNFTEKLFSTNLDKYFKGSKLLINNFKKNKLISLINNLKICFKNTYKTNNFTFLSLHIKFDIIENELKKKFINKAIFFEGDSPDQQIISQCIKKNGGKTYLFQQGTYRGKIVPSFFRDLNHDYFFTWGDFFKSEIKRFNPKTKIISIGRVGRNNTNKPKKNIIIFASQDTNVAGSKNFSKDSRKLFYEFCEWCLKEFKNYKIYFKPHPKYPYSKKALDLMKYENFYMCKNTDDIINFFPNAKFLISISSTTLIDALSYNIVPFNFIPFEPITPNLEKFKIGIITKNLQDSKKKLERLIKEKKYYKKIAYKNKNHFIKDNFNKCFKEQIRKKII